MPSSPTTIKREDRADELQSHLQRADSRFCQLDIRFVLRPQIRRGTIIAHSRR
jgi:hypothetical protein